MKELCRSTTWLIVGSCVSANSCTISYTWLLMMKVSAFVMQISWELYLVLQHMQLESLQCHRKWKKKPTTIWMWWDAVQYTCDKAKMAHIKHVLNSPKAPWNLFMKLFLGPFDFSFFVLILPFSVWNLWLNGHVKIDDDHEMSLKATKIRQVKINDLRLTFHFSRSENQTDQKNTIEYQHVLEYIDASTWYGSHFFTDQWWDGIRIHKKKSSTTICTVNQFNIHSFIFHSNEYVRGSVVQFNEVRISWHVFLSLFHSLNASRARRSLAHPFRISMQELSTRSSLVRFENHFTLALIHCDFTSEWLCIAWRTHWIYMNFQWT